MARLGTVAYLNARPLTGRLDRTAYEVREGHPSDVARWLRAGEVDLALVPVAAVLQSPDLRVLGEHCIGAEGPVQSVLLVAETPPEQWTRVLLDGVSRTSVTLARLLLRRGPLASRVAADIVIEDVPPGSALDVAGGSVAALVIGDAARRLPDRMSVRLDLAELWHDWTGLPFVFAVWAGRADVEVSVLSHVREAGRLGLAARHHEFSGQDLEYVTRYIRYDLDDRALIGLRRYAALAFADGLVGTEDVELFGPPEPRRPRRSVDELLAKAADGESLSPEELAVVHEDARTVDLALAADLARERRGVAVDRGFRLALWVTSDPTDLDGVTALAAEGREAGASEAWIEGSPAWSLADWQAVVRAAGASGLAVRAGSVEALVGVATREGSSIAEVGAALRSAGAVGLAEETTLTLNEPLRARLGLLAPRAWLQAARALLDAGLRGVFGLELGAGEDLAARRTHLAALAALHQATGGVDGLRIAPLRPGRGLAPVGATAEDVLRTVALARLLAPLVEHHEAGWLPEAPGLAQAALHGGADRLGTVFLPARDAQVDAPYVNPRAAVGKRRAEDPWDRFVKEVNWNLDKAGLPRPNA